MFQIAGFLVMKRKIHFLYLIVQRDAKQDKNERVKEASYLLHENELSASELACLKTEHLKAFIVCYIGYLAN